MMKKMNDIKAKSGKVPTCANPACPGLAAVGWVQFAGGELKPACSACLAACAEAEQDMMSGLATDGDLDEGGSSKRPASPPGRDGYGSPLKKQATSLAEYRAAHKAEFGGASPARSDTSIDDLLSGATLLDSNIPAIPAKGIGRRLSLLSNDYDSNG